MPYATTVNVRDRLATFIVGLASVADRWEMHPSADKDRFRQGLGRSTDPKVVALRQAVLDKCVAIKGPSPGQGAPPAPGPLLNSPSCTSLAPPLPLCRGNTQRHRERCMQLPCCTGLEQRLSQLVPLAAACLHSGSRASLCAAMLQIPCLFRGCCADT